MNVFNYLQIKLNQISSFIPPPSSPSDEKSNVLIIFVHPRSNNDGFAHGALQATLKGLNCHSNNTIRIRRLYYDSTLSSEQAEEECISYKKDFNPKLNEIEHRKYMNDSLNSRVLKPADLKKSGYDSEIIRSVRDLQWCDKLILVYPTWWFGLPAILKGYMDRVLIPGVAFSIKEEKSGINLIPLLTNIKKVAVVTSYGSNYSNAFFCDTTRPFISNVFRSLCNTNTTLNWLALYEMDTQTDNNRREHCLYIEETMKNF